MLVQRQRRWADVVQMSYKCFVFAWMALTLFEDQINSILIYYSAGWMDKF